MTITSLLTLREQLGSRLKYARQTLGWTQAQLAKLGGVSKVTQSSYETGLTEPTTAYLRSIQQSGIDLSEVLYGISTQELVARGGVQVSIDWSRLQRCFEDVEFFCQRYAPECPSTYRWKMVAKIYDAHQIVALGAEPEADKAQAQTMQELSTIWQAFGKA
jgi:transcriptional regulator with XRE-family HTH domain